MVSVIQKFGSGLGNRSTSKGYALSRDYDRSA